MLSIDTSLDSKRRRDLESNIEIIWVQITIDVGKSVYVGCASIPYVNHCALDLF